LLVLVESFWFPLNDTILKGTSQHMIVQPKVLHSIPRIYNKLIMVI